VVSQRLGEPESDRTREASAADSSTTRGFGGEVTADGRPAAIVAEEARRTLATSSCPKARKGALRGWAETSSTQGMTRPSDLHGAFFMTDAGAPPSGEARVEKEGARKLGCTNDVSRDDEAKWRAVALSSYPTATHQAPCQTQVASLLRTNGPTDQRTVRERGRTGRVGCFRDFFGRSHRPWPHCTGPALPKNNDVVGYFMRSFIPWVVVAALAGCDAVSVSNNADLAACAGGRSRTLSEECCPDFGVDACGAGLFCAALDGREVPTCFLEGSRRSGETCEEDRSCGSGTCRAGRCQSLLGESCSVDVGCTNPVNNNEVIVCLPSTLECVRGGFDLGDSCDDDVECDSGACFNDQCVDGDGASLLGDNCVSDDDCGSGDGSIFFCGGYSETVRACMTECDDDSQCPGDSVCGSEMLGYPFCLKSCRTNSDCERSELLCLEGVMCVPPFPGER
jgi:hypothetical protein